MLVLILIYVGQIRECIPGSLAGSLDAVRSRAALDMLDAIVSRRSDGTRGLLAIHTWRALRERQTFLPTPVTMHFFEAQYSHLRPL